MKMRPLDFVILAIGLGAACVWSLFVYGASADNARLVIAVHGRNDAWLFPADAEETITVEGPLGNTVVSVNRGTASVVSSPCANQLCVAQGKIHRAGGSISCLPNRVMITIQGGNNGIDGGTW
jgi:hypothetical protein